MNPLQSIVEKTEELKALLGQVTSGNRLELISKVNDLLDEREILIKKLDLTTLKKNSIVKELILEEEEIKKRMKQVLSDIRRDILLVRKKRKSGENYINPYHSLRKDGVFFDTRK